MKTEFKWRAIEIFRARQRELIRCTAVLPLLQLSEGEAIEFDQTHSQRKRPSMTQSITSDQAPSAPIRFPIDIEQCIEHGASNLGRTLEILEWPNGGKDAPCHEVNALINISSCLSNLPKPYHVYAEATVPPRGRVDMIGFNGETAIAIEAKSFGNINKKSNEVINDLKRLETFSPSLTTELAGSQAANQWWNEAKNRWGIIVISSFRGREVRDAWLAQDESDFKKQMNIYRPIKKSQSHDDEIASGYLALYRSVSSLYRRSAQITDGARWRETGEGWLLWAAIPLSRGDG